MANDLEANFTGDPTNPNPEKPRQAPKAKKPSLEQLGGLNSARPNDYATDHDTYLNQKSIFGNDVHKGSGYDPAVTTSGMNMNDVRSANQGFSDKAANGLIKFGGLAGTMFAGTFTALPYGLSKTAFNVAGKLASGNDVDAEDFTPMYDNPATTALNAFNKTLEERFPNYYSQKEQDASALSADNILTANFLFDKIVKNAGYTVGAMRSGKAIGTMLGNASKILAKGSLGAEKVAEVEAMLGQGMKLPQALEKVASTMNKLDKANQYITTSLMAAGEAQFEANDAHKTGIEALTKDFMEKNKREPLEFEMQDIKRRAAAMGNTVFAANLAILGLSDTIQFGSSLTKGFKSETRALGKTRMVNGIEEAVAPTTFSRAASRASTFGKGMITEGAEEGSQTFTQKASTDYYTRKQDLDAKADIDDMLRSTAYGIGQTLGSKEGLESILLGGITGVGSHAGMALAGGQLKQEWNKADEEYEKTQTMLDKMSEFSKMSLLDKKYQGAVRSLSIQNSLNQAVEEGDAFAYNNLSHDRLKSMVQTFTEAGRLPQLLTKLDELNDLDSTEFQELFPDADVTKKSVPEYVSTLKNEVVRMSKLWDDVDSRFVQSSPEQKEQLWSALSNIENRKKREDEISQLFLEKGISFDAILMKNGGKREGAEKEFRELAAEYMTEKGEVDFSQAHVDDFFKLAEDRRGTVRKYGEMKEGKGFISPVAATPPVEEAKVEETPENKPSAEPSTSTPTPTTPDTSSAAAAPTNDAPVDEDGDMINAMLRAKIKHQKSGFTSLSADEKAMYAKFMSAKPGTPESVAGPKAAALFIEAINAGTLDELEAKLGGGSIKTPVQGEDDKAEAQKFNADHSTVLGQLAAILKMPVAKASNALTQLAVLIPTIEELKTRAAKLNLTTSKLEDTIEAIKSRFPTKTAKPVVVKAGATGKVGTSFKVDKLTPLRIIRVKLNKDGNGQVESKETVDLYTALQSAVAEMPEGFDTTMGSTVLYKNVDDKESYDVMIGRVKVGYLQNTDENRDRYSTVALETQDTLRQLAKDQGSVNFEIKWNFGLNNKKDDKIQPLNKSVFNENNIIGIFRNTKTGDIQNMRTKSMLDGATSIRMRNEFQTAKISDGYVLVTKSPDGNTRYIGMTGMPVQGQDDWNSLNQILNLQDLINGEQNADTQATNLKNNFWIAAARPLDETTPAYSIVWQKNNDGNPYLSIVENARSAEDKKGGSMGQFGKAGISVKLDSSQPIVTQEDFLNSLSLFQNEEERFAEMFPGKELREVFASNPLRLEIPVDQAAPMDRFNLSVNGQKPWNASGIISSIPQQVSSPKITSEQAEIISEPLVIPTSTSPRVEPPADIKRRGTSLENKKPEEMAYKEAVEGSPVFKQDFEKIMKDIQAINPNFKADKLRNFLNGMYTDGTVWGVYSQHIMYIAENAGKGTHYHEAFHAVFRSLFNSKERQYLINVIQESGLVDTSESAINQFRNSRKEYSQFSNQEATLRMYEEALADMFQNYMNNRPEASTGIFSKLKTLFDRFLSMIGFVRGHKSELDSIFEGIAKGRYKNRQLQEIGSEVVFKSLPSLSSEKTSLLVGMIRQNLLDRHKKGMNPRDLITSLINEIKQRSEFSVEYNPNIHSNDWLESNNKFYDNGRIYPDIFDENYYDQISDEVESSLRSFKLTLKDDDIYMSTEDDAGKRGKDIEYDVNTFSMTGFDKLAPEIKKFISQVGLAESDGILVPISVIGTYSQLQRILAGTESYEEMYDIIERYANSSPEMMALLVKLDKNGNDEYFQEAFRNAFTLSYADHLHLDVDQDSSESKLYAANRQDTGQIQLERYKRNYERLISNGNNLAAESKGVMKALDDLQLQIEDGEVGDIYTLQAALKSVGIEISDSMIINIIEGKETNGDEDYSIDDFADDLTKIMLGMGIGNPYKISQQEVEDEESESADAVSRIKRIGQIDSNHRNDIYQTSFLNSEGETIYSFTKPNFELVRGLEIEREIGIDGEFYENNYLLRDLAAKKRSNPNYLKISIFGGLREKNKETGITSRKIDPKSKILSEHMLYSNGYVEWARHEAKSTFTVVNVGKGNKFTQPNGQLSASTMKAWKGFINQDVQRILKVTQELESLQDSQLIEGYHFQGKEAKGYDPVTKAPIRPNPNDPSTFGNGLKFIQFPMLQQIAQEYMETQIEDAEGEKRNPTWLEAVNHATSNLDVFLQGQHDLMTETYIDTLKNEGIDLEKNFDLMAGEYADSYAGKDKEVNYIRDYVAGTYTMANAYEQLSSGEQAYYASHVDITKRRAAMLAAGNSLGPGSYNAAMISDSFMGFDVKNGNSIPLNYFDKVLKKLDGREWVNKSDAQSYSTATRWLFAMKRLGKMTKEMEYIVRNMIAGTYVSEKEQKLVMEFATANPIKNVYFDGKVYVKTSIIPLFPQLTSTYNKGTGLWEAKPEFRKLHLLRTSMEENGIDEVYRESAMKLQRFNKQFEDNNGNFSFNEDSKFILDNKYWREQVNNPSGKMKITLGTQLLQLIDSEMPDADEVEYNGKTTTIGKVRAEYQKLLASATYDANTRATALLKKVDMSTGKQQTLLFNVLKASAAASGSSDTALEYYQQDDQGKLILGVNLPHMTEVFEQGILSYFNKNVFGKKVPGMKLTLVSSDGVKVKDEQTGEYRDLRVHRKTELDGKEVIDYAECYLSEEMLYKYDLTEKTFREQSPEIQQEILQMLGFRIPTQSHHSMIPFKVVGFIPAIYGSSIFAPSEITWLAGSDFDVDSLFVNRKEFYKDSEGNLHVYGKAKDSGTQYYEWKKTIEKNDRGFELLFKDYKENDARYNEAKEALKKDKNDDDLQVAFENEEYRIKRESYAALGYPSTLKEWEVTKPLSTYAYNNGVLDTMLSFMLNPKNAESIFTPASMTSMANMADEIGSLLGESENSNLPYNFAGSLFSHWKNNSTGKANVGPAANASKTSAFLTKMGVELDSWLQIGDAVSTGYASNEEIESSDFSESKEGEPVKINSKKSGRKADSLSTTVSAMTDNAKERLAAKLNLTVDNLAVFGNMLALGFGMRRTMFFANQPILRKLSQRVMNAKSHLLSEGSNWEISQKFLGDMEKILEMDAQSIANLRNEAFSDVDMMGAITKENNKLFSDLSEGNKRASELTEKEKKMLQLQYKILNKYVQLEDQTRYFSAVNSILNTNKGPKPSFEAYDTLLEKYKMLKSDLAPFDVLSVLKKKAPSIYANLSIIGNEIVPRGADYFIHRTTRFTKLKEKLSKWGRMSEKKRKSMKRAYTTELAMTMFNKSLRSAGLGQLQDYIHLLTSPMDEKGAKANIITRYNDILNKYPDLRDNLALNQLTAKEPNSQNMFHRLEYNTSMRTDAEFKEELMSSISDLRTFGTNKVDAETGKVILHPVRQFHEDLFLYLALKDSLQFKTNSFVSLLAPSRFTALARSLNEAQRIIKDIKLMPGEKDKNKAFQTLTGFYPRQFETNFLMKWVKGYDERKGWKQIDLYEAKNKSLVHPKDKNNNYDYSKLEISSALKSEQLDSLFKFEKENSILGGKFIDFPRVLQTRKGRKQFDDETPDFVYNSDVELWIRTNLKDGVATYEKVDIGNFNPKLSPFGLPVNFEVPKPERKQSEATNNQIAEMEAQEEAERLAAEEGNQDPADDEPNNSSAGEGEDLEIPGGAIIPSYMQKGTTVTAEDLEAEEEEEGTESEIDEDNELPGGVQLPAWAKQAVANSVKDGKSTEEACNS